MARSDSSGVVPYATNERFMSTFTALPVSCMAKGAMPMAVMARTMAHDGQKAVRRNRTMLLGRKKCAKT